ncbi:uncharacterized protein UMAG_10186 [Mycosarcoma maydis]|uniref:Uncharacterized protein n=1 Tax=Mycosarcoma maydis TaxID=5270 RepID=A0A0D1E2M4_MYCMD|nr:uncharacterized protein UMAG_10186 [Ustilago maydis 521]KIS70081.1 hypothetical protein UMAG_10186 [Ustilago maydis 521]|eukprot:XP_011388349.1 hypothetical protein UMAG_10186 [Ustilago maydis 521]
MRASIRAALLVAAAALVALQVAQPVSGHLVDREIFENVTPTLYDYARRAEEAGPSVLPTTTTSKTNPTATPGSNCKANSDCASGVCDQGKCVPKKNTGPINSFCTSDDQCATSGYCYRGSCQYIKPSGANCYKDSGCIDGNCVNKRCVANKSLPNNSACTKSTQCRDGSFCSNSKCDTIKGVGSYCYKNQGCTSGFCINNRCSGRGLANNGQFCTNNARCKSNFCFRSACRAKRARGQPCSLNDTCISGRCRQNRTCA